METDRKQEQNISVGEEFHVFRMWDQAHYYQILLSLIKQTDIHGQQE